MTTKLPQRPLVIVPGWQNSGPDHWQTLWEQSSLKAIRFVPRSFDQPDLDDWVESILGAVELAAGAFGQNPILVGHSLGSLAVIAASQKYPQMDAAGLFCVAVPEPSVAVIGVFAPTFVDLDKTFTVSQHSVDIVMSTNDPYDPRGRAALIAKTIGADLINAGPLGHINAASGIGDWEQGQKFLRDFAGA